MSPGIKEQGQLMELGLVQEELHNCTNSNIIPRLGWAYTGRGKLMNIKPCPFCGSVNMKIAEALRQHKVDGLFLKEFKVFCNNCESCSGYGSSNQAAIKIWNQRAEVSLFE